MILPIYVYGNPVLRKKSMEIDMDYPDLEQLISDMYETMYQASGVGLAAPQVGKNVRLFVIDSSGFLEAYPDTPVYKGAFINPRIIREFGEDFTFSEGCLSLPEIHENVVRKSEVEISFMNEKGEQKTEKFSGLLARIIQHEYDHLEGLVFTDKVSSIKKMVLKRKLSEVASGKIKPNYKTKIVK